MYDFFIKNNERGCWKKNLCVYDIHEMSFLKKNLHSEEPRYVSTRVCMEGLDENNRDRDSVVPARKL